MKSRELSSPARGVGGGLRNKSIVKNFKTNNTYLIGRSLKEERIDWLFWGLFSSCFSLVMAP